MGRFAASALLVTGNETVPYTVIDAIKQGIWDFEPCDDEDETFDATAALPGTQEKLCVLASRVARGLPLWHPSDRISYEERER